VNKELNTRVLGMSIGPFAGNSKSIPAFWLPASYNDLCTLRGEIQGLERAHWGRFGNPRTELGITHHDSFRTFLSENFTQLVLFSKFIGKHEAF